jgi:serine-type D-Ala-D-Ala carboxypeptidase (penicillin-binding protein 5/6)
MRTLTSVGLLAVVAAIVVLEHQSPSPSPSRAASPPAKVLRTDRRLGSGRASRRAESRAHRGPVPRDVWPVDGQAAYTETGQPVIHAGPDQHPAPIASVAKVMTAYVVLRDHPLRAGDDGPAITLTDADVAGTDVRRERGESVVSVAAGEELTERQALLALLLPSANNIAAVLARWDAGSVDAFVDRMNAAARSLGMTRTRYTDPSGFDDATVSTAADQVRTTGSSASRPARTTPPAAASRSARSAGSTAARRRSRASCSVSRATTRSGRG